MGFEKTYDYTDAPTIREFNQSDKFFRLLIGPFGSGKSSGCVAEIIDRGIRQAPNAQGLRQTKWAAVRNTFPQLTDTTMATFFYWLPPEFFGNFNKTEHRYVINKIMLEDKTRVEIEVLFRALDKEEHVRNLLSLELTGAWFNEVREMPKVIVDAMEGRCSNRYPKDVAPTWNGIIADTNPPDQSSWIFKRFEEELPLSEELRSRYEIFKQPSGRSEKAENLIHLGHGNRDNGRKYYTEMAIGKDPEYIKVYIDGEYGYVRDGKPVYSNYMDSIHCVEKDIEPVYGYPIIASFDFGLCYDDKTEVLTETGWKLFKDISVACDKVATLNRETRELEYVLPNFKIEEDHDGEMLEWANQSINFCVTPEHIVPYTKRESENLPRFATAEQLSKELTTHNYVDLTAKWNGNSCVVLPSAFTCDNETFAEFMGIYLSEGSVNSVSNSNKIYIAQRKKNKTIEDILKRTRFNWKEDEYSIGFVGWSVSNKQLRNYLIQFGHAGEKHIPQEIRNMSLDNIRKFIYAYTVGDGHIRIRKNGAEEHTIFTTSERMAGDLQELCLKSGWHSSACWRKPQTSVIIEDGKPRTIINNGGWVITVKKRAKRAELLKEAFRRIHYKGKRYCLNVPYHTLYIRRNGRPSWNGNTPACVLSQYLHGGKFNVLKEFWEDNSGLRGFVKEVIKPYLAAHYKGYEIITTGDPAGMKRNDSDERNCFMELKSLGFPATPASTNSLLARINAVDSFLTKMVEGKPAFQLSPSCTMLRRGFIGEYKLHQIRGLGERFSELPLKNDFSHLHDALQYGALLADRGGVSGAKGISGTRYDSPVVEKKTKSMLAWT
jgi:hypothetical protein